MSARDIQVKPGLLSAGGDSCLYAAGSAKKGAEQLGGATAASGIFGDFAEAHDFHSTFAAARQSHQEQLHGHHATLTGLSGKANEAAEAFTATDESGADAITSAACDLE